MAEADSHTEINPRKSHNLAQVQVEVEAEVEAEVSPGVGDGGEAVTEADLLSDDRSLPDKVQRVDWGGSE